MVWYVIALAAFSAAIALVVVIRVREGRYIQKKASEAMSPSVMAELDEERAAAYARRDRFREILRSAQRGKDRSP